MFVVNKLVEKATNKKPWGNLESLSPENVSPRLAFHYGIPSEAAKLAYDPVQRIVAISTRNGQIKLLGKDNTQALLESNDVQPSKFLQFVNNEGILLNITLKNQIEVWDVDQKILSYVHVYDKEITSFTILQQCSFIFIGDSTGNVTVWKLNQDHHLERMKYWVPFYASRGDVNEASGCTAIKFISPQPTAESKRILLIYADGLLALWDIQESKCIFTTGGITAQFSSQETKQVTSACWVCPFGSKVAVGYSTGDIYIYTIPSNSQFGNDSSMTKDSCNPQLGQFSKLNLGYRLENIPIASLKWGYSDGKSTRLYVVGASETPSSNTVQVILLNEDAESRTVKLGLQVSDLCLDLEIISCPNEHSKNKSRLLLLIGKSGQMFAYDDHAIERYLLQFQSKSPPSIPREVVIKLPFSDSRILSAQFISNNSSTMSLEDQDYMSTAKIFPSLLPSESKHSDSFRCTGFSKIKNMYITGHSDGTIKFWDVSCSLLIPLLSITQQSEDGSSESGIAVTAIYYCTDSRRLFSGDKSGAVRIYQFKPEPFATENSFFSLPGGSKKGSNHFIQSVKLIKVKGSVLCFNISSSPSHLAVGSEKGHVSVIELEGPSLLYQKQIGSELSSDIISLQFATCDLQSFEKKILVLTTRDSSIVALEADTGNTLSNRVVQPKKPFKALFMQILGDHKSNISDGMEVTNAEDAARKQLLLLLCSERAAYIYSLEHAVQGVKKVWYKKKFHSSCTFASTFCSNSSAGLTLVFSSGKIEIRSLPQLTLVKESTVKSFMYPSSKPSSFSELFMCSSANGEVIMARGDQEIAFTSVLLNNQIYRHLESLAQVYNRNLVASEDGLSPRGVPQKEKKKGIFGSVFKDVTGTKANHGADNATEDARNFGELLSIFSVANFPEDVVSIDNTTLENDGQLDIDDIDIDDLEETPKTNNMMALLNKQKLTSKFQSFKGKLKQMTVKNERHPAQDEPQNEKTGAVDQIKKKYGFSSSNETSVAKVAEMKLAENVKKLQGINLKTSEMQDNARSFSSMAKEALRLVEQKNNADKL